MTITEQIAEYICDEFSRPLSEATIHQAKRAVIDWFAATYSGSIQDPNPMLRESLVNTDDAKQAIIFPEGQFSTVRTAAFLNGASAHTSEFDDIFTVGKLGISAPREGSQLSNGINIMKIRHDRIG